MTRASNSSTSAINADFDTIRAMAASVDIADGYSAKKRSERPFNILKRCEHLDLVAK
jgi:hypothetical protein